MMLFRKNTEIARSRGIMLCFSFFFFFYGDGDPRDLHGSIHSFPTRRSSDLRAAARALVRCASALRDSSETAARSRRSEIGRAHVSTPVTLSHLVCRLLLE